MASSALARSRAIAVRFPLPQNVHGSVFFRENAYVAILAADSKRSFWAAWNVMNNNLSFSVRLAMCPVERVRDPSGCRASGLTPELPVHVVLVPPLLVPPLLVSSVAGSAVVGSVVVGSAAASFSGAGSAAASFSGAGSAAASSSGAGTDCPRKFPPHCPIDASSLIFFSGTGGIGLQARTCIRQIHHIEV